MFERRSMEFYTLSEALCLPDTALWKFLDGRRV